MRAGTWTTSAVAATVLTLLLAAVAPALAGPDDGPGRAPTGQDVAAAEAAVETKALDVDSVQAQLAGAEQRLVQREIAAAQAVEAFNAARFHAQEAAQAAEAAQLEADEASVALVSLREAYVDAINTSYRLGPSLSPFGALSDADGVSGILENQSLLQVANDAIDGTYETYEAAEAAARAADQRADVALDEASAAEGRARTARDAAEAAAADAADQTASYATERDRLIAELAELQDISVDLAREHQEALEQAAAEAATLAAQEAAEQAAADAAQQAAEAEPEPAPEPTPSAEPTPEPPTPTPPAPSPDPGPTTGPSPDPEPTPDPTPPAPSGGAAAAISFARAQIGEPYKYGAAGPSSWDCSGLTMMAWQQGGISLPHYSAGQYSTSTPIGIGDLQPGDLLFWGSKPSSIYHVALYVGNGQMIHAPRTGRDVEQVSMYYWITPSFFARP